MVHVWRGRGHGPRVFCFGDAQSQRVLAFCEVTHDCDSEFLQYCRLIDFQSELTLFAVPGSEETTLAKSKNKGKKTSTGNKGSKLVDVNQVRARFIVKITAVIKMTKAQLVEVEGAYKKYCEQESDLMAKYKSYWVCKFHFLVVYVMVWEFWKCFSSRPGFRNSEDPGTLYDAFS